MCIMYTYMYGHYISLTYHLYIYTVWSLYQENGFAGFLFRFCRLMLFVDLLYFSSVPIVFLICANFFPHLYQLHFSSLPVAFLICTKRERSHPSLFSSCKFTCTTDVACSPVTSVNLPGWGWAFGRKSFSTILIQTERLVSKSYNEDTFCTCRFANK